MLQLSVFSPFQKLRNMWASLGTISKLAVALTTLAILIAGTFYFFTKPQKTSIAEITTIPATPPYYPSNNINLQTSSAMLKASNIDISVNGYTIRSFNFVPSGVSVSSTLPTPDINHTSLELYWNENGQDFRASLFFEAITVPNNIGYETEQEAYENGFTRAWRLSEFSTYDPYNNWISWTSDDQTVFDYQSMQNPLTLEYARFTASRGGNNFEIHVNNLYLSAFLEELNNCSYQNGALICNTQSSPIPSPSITTYPTLSPASSPYSSCIRRMPKLSINPNNIEGMPGEVTTLTATITNEDSPNCGSSQINLNVHVPNELKLNLPQPGMVIPAGSTNQMNFTITAPASNPWNEARTIPVSYSITNPLSNLGAGIVGSYTLKIPAPQTFNLLLKLAGVTGNTAENTQVSLKFYLKDGTVKSITEPIYLNHTSNGIYEANLTISNPLPPGTDFRVKVKAEKHGSVLFCKANDQDQPCRDDEYMTIPTTNGGALLLYLTGMPLPPGDLNPQDGKVDYGDITLLKTLMGKSQSSLSASDIQVGDLNYDGFINSFDIFLILKTMDTRYD